MTDAHLIIDDDHGGIFGLPAAFIEELERAGLYTPYDGCKYA